MFPGFSGTPNVEARPRNEIVEFAKAWLGTALAFALLYSGGIGSDPQFLLSSRFLTLLILAAITAGLGVILHELAHRVVARHFGATAHFVANDGMLVVSILMAAFTSFLFLAPGAVWHTGYLTKRQVGLIAAAGPVVNMVLSIIFVGALLVVNAVPVPRVVELGLLMGFSVNSILGVFNMLPFGPIDGAKVLSWSAPVFGILAAIAVAIAFGLPRIEALGLPRLF